MFEIVQDYSLIQDFVADIPPKVSFEILNQPDYDSFDLF